VTIVCMKLHYLCIDRNVAVPNHRFVGDIREGNQWVVDNHGRAGSDPWHDITANCNDSVL
jgi:hypothetical protein